MGNGECRMQNAECRAAGQPGSLTQRRRGAEAQRRRENWSCRGLAVPNPVFLTETGDFDMTLPRSALSALRSPLSALRSPLSALRSPLSALRSPLSALRSALCALRSPLSALRSPLCALRSPLSALRSPLSTLHFLFPSGMLQYSEQDLFFFQQTVKRGYKTKPCHFA
jgi:hypothetical protein